MQGSSKVIKDSLLYNGVVHSSQVPVLASGVLSIGQLPSLLVAGLIVYFTLQLRESYPYADIDLFLCGLLFPLSF